MQAAAANEATCDGKRCDSFSWKRTYVFSWCPILQHLGHGQNKQPQAKATRPPSSMWEVVDAGKWAPSWANHTDATASTNEIACHQTPSTPVAFGRASCCFQYHCVKYYPSCTFARTQGCCEPALQSSTEQHWGGYSVLTSAAVLWCCITANLHE
jgi:hypothetical protein